MDNFNYNCKTVRKRTEPLVKCFMKKLGIGYYDKDIIRMASETAEFTKLFLEE